ncbi:hypothetical protein [Lysobacter sp. Root690]|uniref:hypothetical protein n=1 Tax=Lysobacter sp. Root690 TaxID=1736588 RepID=UPI001F25A51D|nr:hypothetical protein [Lysobacter sp. Root690]
MPASLDRCDAMFALFDRGDETSADAAESGSAPRIVIVDKSDGHAMSSNSGAKASPIIVASRRPAAKSR